MKNVNKKKSANPTAFEKTKIDAAPAENASNEELFLKDIFDSEEKLDTDREALGRTENRNRESARSVKTPNEGDVPDGELLSSEEIDAFFDNMIKCDKSRDGEVPEINTEEEISTIDDSWLETARVTALDDETLSGGAEENDITETFTAEKPAAQATDGDAVNISTDRAVSDVEIDVQNTVSPGIPLPRHDKRKNGKPKKSAEKNKAVSADGNAKKTKHTNEALYFETSELEHGKSVEEHKAEPILGNATKNVETQASTDTAVGSELDRSLDGLTYEDMGSAFPKRSKKPDVFRIGMLAICLVVFAYSMRYLVNNIYEKYKSDSVYNEINDGLNFSIPGSVAQGGIVSLLTPDSLNAATPTMDDIIKNGVSQSVTNSHTAELAKVRASLEHLKNINSDLYGYIVVPGTNISYPIAQHESDNDYYLDRAYNGEHLVNGSIFADVRCNDDVMMNYNTVLYGHNVTSGSMFNHVSMFFERDFFENTLIYIYTYDGIFVYKPFSIHETEYDSGYIKTAFATVEDFVEFADNLRELSDIESDAEFTAESRMLTLSTCTNGIYSRRYALHAYLVERITD